MGSPGRGLMGEDGVVSPDCQVPGRPGGGSGQTPDPALRRWVADSEPPRHASPALAQPALHPGGVDHPGRLVDVPDNRSPARGVAAGVIATDAGGPVLPIRDRAQHPTSVLTRERASNARYVKRST